MSGHPVSAPIALIGCGSIGLRHLRNLIDHGCTNIIAYDPSENARDAARNLGATVSSDLAAVWNSHPFVAFICTPSNLHLEQALAAAYRGIHLFIEKPLSHQRDGLAELARLATAQRLITFVGCNMRFHPGPARLRGLLDEGVIGTILAARLHTGSYLPRWRPNQDYRCSYSASSQWGGALLDCIHEIDLALWLFGPATLKACICRPATSIGLSTVGLAEMLLMHDCQAISSVHLNFVQRNYRRSIEVIGAEGSLSWDFTRGEICQFGPSGEMLRSIRQPADWQINRMYQDELTYFLSCLRDGIPTFNDVSCAAATLRLALKAKEFGDEDGRHHSGPGEIESASR